MHRATGNDIHLKMCKGFIVFFFFSSRRRHTRYWRDWSSDVCSSDLEYQFTELPGLVMEYEAVLERGNTKIRFTASNIDMDPVPVAKFDVPKSGYRIL